MSNVKWKVLPCFLAGLILLLSAVLGLSAIGQSETGDVPSAPVGASATARPTASVVPSRAPAPTLRPTAAPVVVNTAPPTSNPTPIPTPIPATATAAPSPIEVPVISTPEPIPQATPRPDPETEARSWWAAAGYIVPEVTIIYAACPGFPDAVACTLGYTIYVSHTEYDLASVLGHEFGHVVGFTHAAPFLIMNPEAWYGPGTRFCGLNFYC
jgi:hypothetical protein